MRVRYSIYTRTPKDVTPAATAPSYADAVEVPPAVELHWQLAGRKGEQRRREGVHGAAGLVKLSRRARSAQEFVSKYTQIQAPHFHTRGIQGGSSSGRRRAIGSLVETAASVRRLVPFHRQ